MNKNQIQKFAVNARRELISRVKQRAYLYGVHEDTVEPESASMNGRLLTPAELLERRTLVQQVKEKGFEQVVEEVAYTWFNRFCALRYMEVNNYLPVRVFTDEEGAFHPQIMTEAVNLDMSTVDIEKVYEMVNADQKEDLFKYLLICQCNELNKVLPGMFQTIDDYTELLFPDNLLRQGSVIEQMVSMIDEDDWKDTIQIVGWLYQYYNSEPKDKVFADLKKNIKISKNNIPAATQLFTPDWIVRYMVENSLGRLWLEGHPSAELRSKWAYYLDEAEQTPEVQAQLGQIRADYRKLEPKDIKVIDPCMGSGHILAYMFDILMQIYLEYGYTEREAVRSILENNLYGLDIDDRAGQLAYFTVMMKARQYDRRFFTRGIQPHVYAIVESNHVDKYTLEYFCNDDAKLKKAMDAIIEELHDAKEYGSILTVTQQDWAALYHRFDEIAEDIDMSRDAALRQLLPLVQVAEALAQKYDAVVTNPPYMGSSGMGGKLSDYVKKNYPDSKSDLFACFIEHWNRMVTQYGYNCMVTMQSWMFLSSFEKMRVKLLQTKTITNLMHMENMVMGIAFGTAVTVFQNNHVSDYKGTYNQIKLQDIENGIPKMFPIPQNRFAQISTDNFSKIPGSPVAYWVSKAVLGCYKNKSIYDFANPCKGIDTGDNDVFLRLWHEVSGIKCFLPKGIPCCADDFLRLKWFPYNKGGNYRRWYGNNEYVLNWEENGNKLRQFKGSNLRNKDRYFEKGITWSTVTSGKSSFRFFTYGFLFDNGGSCLFADKHLLYIQGFLNSSVSQALLSIQPTLNNQPGTIGSIPLLISPNENMVEDLVGQNIGLCKDDWDSFETSWDFQRHPLLNYGISICKGLGNGPNFPTSNIKSDRSKTSNKLFEENAPKAYTIDSAFRLWSESCDDRFAKLKANEEELNRIFIDIYGLQDELIPEVEDKDVTVRKAALGRDIRSLISYAVGCMFGRYSLDEPGLIYAGGEWDASKYKTFPADRDNIIPICDDAYFEDDMANRFEKWVETVFGAATLEENLQFIADALGGRGDAREVIRNYFINDFYADHLKVYQKRPIYWLFDSGKKNGFKALIYMHRYDQDTLARLRTDYVHEQQERYRTVISQTERSLVTAEGSTRVKLNKKLAKVKAQLDEASVFEEKVAHLADQRIAIDLDDGVKHNYALFPEILAKIK